MKHIFFIIFVFVGIGNVQSQQVDVPIYETFAEVSQKYFNKSDNKVHVINFWATWCKPCIKELPYIDALTDKYKDKVKVTLISLDFPRKLDTKLKPFITQNNLKSEVILLDDGKVNEWINEVDPSWSGAIPATLLFYNGKKLFFEKEFHSMAELEAAINDIKNNN